LELGETNYYLIGEASNSRDYNVDSGLIGAILGEGESRPGIESGIFLEARGEEGIPLH